MDVEPMIPSQVPFVVGNNGGGKDLHKGVIIMDDGMEAEGGRRGKGRREVNRDSDMAMDGCLSSLARPVFQGHFKRVVRESKPKLVALFEPRISGTRAAGVIRRLGLSQSFRVDGHGFSGGIWILWEDDLDVQLLRISNQFIHMRVVYSPSEPPVFVSAIYASPNVSLRRFIWSQLITLDPGSDNAWILGSDFNAIYAPEDRLGGARSKLDISRGMENFVFEAVLSEVKFRGPRFTWKRGSLSQRLERCLANERWLDRFPGGGAP
ncbi:hypothetical protein GQ457_15G021360 [Hibiscus cannabinus]